MTRSAPGFFGKLPSRGDFVVRRLPPDFVTPWDEWLEAALAQSRAQLGERWLDVYLTSPIWRFVLSPGVAGAEAYCGVVMPNVDRVGRYFPLVAAAPLDLEGRAPAHVVAAAEQWFASVEALMLETLADPPLELDEFDARLAQLRLPDPLGAARVESEWRWPAPAVAVHWHCAVPPDTALAGPMSALLGALLESELGRYALWWTEGSEQVEPSLLVTDGLPAARAYAAMLEGSWTEPWATARVASPSPPPRASTPPASTPRAALAWVSAAVTDPGNSRDVNEDSYACRDDLGVWLVADGLGGHQAGHLASNMVTAIADELDETATLTERVRELEHGVRTVNSCLHVLAQQLWSGELVGSTIVGLVAEGNELMCLWAGDSRIYRWRDGTLDQLSHDHSENDPDEPRTNIVTRAVGGPGTLDLAVERATARAGDRYLLCTDGLYAPLAPERIAAALALAPDDACAALRSAVLAGEARDNLTAVVVSVSTAAARAE
jgi:type VI secretion system protein ImpM